MRKLFNFDKRKSSLVREYLGGYQQYKSVEVDTHPQPFPNMGREKQAFTLAEVLITLAIIGVVAAMTIPTLIGNYKKLATETKIKRFYSTIVQAIKLSEIDNGDALTWDIPDMVWSEPDVVYTVAQKNNAVSSWNKYYAPYIKYSGIDETSTESDILITLLDGSQFRFNNGECLHFIYYPFGYDKNSSAGVNFHFLQCNKTYNATKRPNNPTKSFGCFTDSNTLQLTREDALAACSTSKYYCSCLLEYDNWEFKDDNPYKF